MSDKIKIFSVFKLVVYIAVLALVYNAGRSVHFQEEPKSIQPTECIQKEATSDSLEKSEILTEMQKQKMLNFIMYHNVTKPEAIQTVDAIRIVAKQEGIPVMLLFTVIALESGFQRDAVNGPAIGLMQVNAEVWQKPGVDLTNVMANIRQGAKIWKMHLKKAKTRNTVAAHKFAASCYVGGCNSEEYYKMLERKAGEFMLYSELTKE